MPYLPHGSVKSHFKQRICQPGARFSESIFFFAIGLLALISQ
jgi:hypothetical protein